MLISMLMPEAMAAETWTVTASSHIGFTAFQKDQPVEGGFEVFAAEVAFDPDDLEASRVEVTIDATSITTGHKDRDATLRNASFFDVAQWPTARFVADRLQHQGGTTYQAAGQLTIRDVTRDVVLPFELTIADDPGDAAKLLATATGELTISRLDYGVGQGDWASTSTIGADVIIRIEVEATRPR
jgi:polyisoprenoid-binding protein YceI